MTRNMKEKDGVILLLVVMILTAIFAISTGVFGVIIGQVGISETFESSSIALYAADQANERTLYRDRIEHDFAIGRTPPTPNSHDSIAVSSGGCAYITVTKTTLQDATIEIQGLNQPCGTITERTVARAFLTTY